MPDTNKINPGTFSKERNCVINHELKTQGSIDGYQLCKDSNIFTVGVKYTNSNGKQIEQINSESKTQTSRTNISAGRVRVSPYVSEKMFIPTEGEHFQVHTVHEHRHTVPKLLTHSHSFR